MAEKRRDIRRVFSVRGILIGFLLLSMAGNLASLWYVHASTSAARFVAQYPYIDPARELVTQEHYLTTLQPLRDTMNKLADEFGRGNTSIYIEFLNTGANISINPDVYIWSASLPKLPVAMAAMKKVEVGNWELLNELVLMEDDRDDKSGSAATPLWQNPIGTRFTIETLLREMLVNSDNTAEHIVFRNLHKDEMDRIVTDLGLDKLFSDEGRLSAKEYSRFFRALYTASFMNREHSQALLAWLDESPFEEFLASALPNDVLFPHKYGENITDRVYADSGIVYIPHRPYLVTVMIQGDTNAPLADDKKRATDFMFAVSNAAYMFFSSQRL